jgi:hypothetical protein
MSLGRRAVRLGVLVVAIACVPTVVQAEWCTGWNTSLYMDGWFSPTASKVTIYGDGLDWDAACCWHEYGIYVWAQHNSEAEQTAWGFDSTWNGAHGAQANLEVGVTVAGTTHWYGEFWVGCYCSGGLVGFEQDQGAVEVPALQLFLDVDHNFQQPADDDLNQYLPGSALNGSSVPVPANEAVPLQTVRLIAAFVGSSGQIVPPPGGVTQVTFELPSTSAFVGYAMNAGTSTDPDFALLSNPSPSFVGNLATVDLGVFDYGGFTTARATAAGVQSPTIRIPRDENNNWLPDAGWWSWAGPNYIADTFGPGLCTSVASCDSDTVPDVGGTSLPARGRTGDGLTHFEEFRGFIVQGGHRRTNPHHKDVFISSDLAVGILYAFPNLPTATHRIHPNEYGPPGPTHKVINLNYQNAAGAEIPHREEQRALRIIDGGFDMVYVGFTFIGAGQHQTCQHMIPGGQPPNCVDRIEVYTGSIQQITNQQNLNYEDALRYTVGHETGHGVNICHRPEPACLNDPGPGDSVMNDTGVVAPAQSDPLAQYDSFDRVQIRLQLNH